MCELDYLNLLKNIIENGNKRNDRTGTGTISLFGEQLKFNLRNNTLPLLTTKKVYWKGVAEELFFFLKGKTDNTYLQNKGVRIWDGNSSREYLDKIGLKDREVGDLGPVYGFQWRHFGAEYSSFNENYDGKGIDQLNNAINLIKTDPTSRRIYVSAWNPNQLKEMCLPPCHISFQFYVNIEKGELSCKMYQRSVDCFLGLPFNIASYGLLTHMIAKMCGLVAGDLIISMGDSHIYANHIEQCKMQLSRMNDIREFPKLNIKNVYDDIEKYEFDDFELIGYNPLPTIKADMAV